MKIAPDFVKKIKDSVNILDVIGEHVVLRKAGSNHVGLCPFHAERTPSFSVSEPKQVYHCHGCHSGGDLVTFVMEIQGLSFAEAVQDLAERAGIAIPKEMQLADRSGGPQQEEQNKTAFRLNRFAAAYFRQVLKEDPKAMDYLRVRGVDSGLENAFYLGSSRSEWDGLYSRLKSAKAPLKLAEQLGLIRPSQQKEYFDLFRNRIIFPILDLRGRVAGFGGRLMPGMESTDQSPKYLNSPESVIFRKSKLAYGLFQAKKYIRETEELVLVEGYFDVLAMLSVGVHNVVACCGTSFTADHLQLFKKFAQKITVLFDGDRAGQEAMERAMELGLDHGVVIYGATLPGSKDPDDFVQKRLKIKSREEIGNEVRARILEAKPLLDEHIAVAVTESQKGPEERSQSLKKIAKWLVRFKDPVGREVRIQALEAQMGVSRQLLLQAMGSPADLRAPSPAAVKPVITANAKPVPKVQKQPENLQQSESLLIKSLIQGSHLEKWEEVRSKLPPGAVLSDLFEHPAAKNFTLQLFNALEKGGRPLSEFSKLTENSLTFSLETLDSQVRSIITEALVTTGEKKDEQAVGAALFRALEGIWARFSQRLRAALSDAESANDTATQSKLMQEYLDVQRKMKEFKHFYE